MRGALCALLTCTALLVLGAHCAEPKAVHGPSATHADADQEGLDSAEDPCVKACTDARRAEAMDWAAIRSQCEASCAER